MTIQLTPPLHCTPRRALFRPRRPTPVIISQHRTLALRYLRAPKRIHARHIRRDNRNSKFNRRDNRHGPEDIRYIFRVGELPEHDEAQQRDHDCAAAEREDGDEADASTERGLHGPERVDGEEVDYYVYEDVLIYD
jgi:hypothetical protein